MRLWIQHSTIVTRISGFKFRHYHEKLIVVGFWVRLTELIKLFIKERVNMIRIKRHAGKKAISILLMFVMILTLVPDMVVKADSSSDEAYNYYVINENGTVSRKSCSDYTLVSDQTTWGANGQTSWYVVDSEVTISDRITVYGNVNLILVDSSESKRVKLTASAGITVGSDTSLTIYGQKNNTGEFYSTAVFETAMAGIGGTSGSGTGIITINGGTITATGGGYGAAGIGGGENDNAGTITINGGRVNATGGESGVAIGPGRNRNNGNILINGGTIQAVGGINTFWGKKPEKMAFSTSVVPTVEEGLMVSTGNDNSSVEEVDYDVLKNSTFTENIDQFVSLIEYNRISENTYTGNIFVYIAQCTKHDFIEDTVDSKRIAKCKKCGLINQEVNYIDENGGSQSCLNYTTVLSQTDWGIKGETSWYVVKDTVHIQDTIFLYGNINLILCDGAKLIADESMIVNVNNSLTIYGQTQGTGELEAHGGNVGAAIGSWVWNQVGDITIHGGKITAISGGSDSAAIGGGYCNDGNTSNGYSEKESQITITGGIVTASCGNGAEAIGNGRYGKRIIVNTDGMKITAGGTKETSVTLEVCVDHSNEEAYLSNENTISYRCAGCKKQSNTADNVLSISKPDGAFQYGAVNNQMKADLTNASGGVSYQWLKMGKGKYNATYSIINKNGFEDLEYGKYQSNSDYKNIGVLYSDIQSGGKIYFEVTGENVTGYYYVHKSADFSSYVRRDISKSGLIELDNLEQADYELEIYITSTDVVTIDLEPNIDVYTEIQGATNSTYTIPSETPIGNYQYAVKATYKGVTATKEIKVDIDNHSFTNYAIDENGVYAGHCNCGAKDTETYMHLLKVAGGTYGVDYKWSYDTSSSLYTMTVLTDKELIISGNTTFEKIIIKEGVNANLILDKPNIILSENTSTDVIEIKENSYTTVTVKGETTLQAGCEHCAIYVPEKSKLTLRGDANSVLNAHSKNISGHTAEVAGIGSHYYDMHGDIDIIGGTIKVYSSWGYGKIGLSYDGRSGVNAKCGTIKLDGCKIYASNLGSLWDTLAAKSKVVSTSQVKLVLKSGVYADTSGLTAFVDDNNGNYTVYGNCTLTENLTIAAGKKLTISQGASLTVPDNITLVNDGVISDYSAVKGKIDGYLSVETAGNTMTASLAYGSGDVKWDWYKSSSNYAEGTIRENMEFVDNSDGTYSTSRGFGELRVEYKIPEGGGKIAFMVQGIKEHDSIFYDCNNGSYGELSPEDNGTIKEINISSGGTYTLSIMAHGVSDVVTVDLKLLAKITDANTNVYQVPENTSAGTYKYMVKASWTKNSNKMQATKNIVVEIGNSGKLTKTEYNQADGGTFTTEIQEDGTAVKTQRDYKNTVVDRITEFEDGSYIKDGYQPKLISGNNSQYVGGENLTFSCDDERINFVEVKVNNSTLDKNDYIVQENKNLTISLKDSYLNRLENGTYNINILSKNGSVTASFIVNKKGSIPINITSTDATLKYRVGLTVDVSSYFQVDAHAGTRSYSIEEGPDVNCINGSILTVNKTGRYKVKLRTEENGVYSSQVAYVWLTIENGVIESSATGYTGTYDQTAHGITVTVTNPTDATVSYSTDGNNYSTQNPRFTDVGVYNVSYKIERENYETVTGNAIVTINAAQQDDAGQNNDVNPGNTEEPGQNDEPIPSDIVLDEEVEEEDEPEAAEEEEEFDEEDIEENSDNLDKLAKATWSKNKFKVSWGKVDTATGYDIFAVSCGKKITNKSLVKTVRGYKNTSATITKIEGKNVSTKKNYKVQIKAFKIKNGVKEYIGNSMQYSVAGTSNTTYTNAKSVKVTSKSITLKKGKTTQIKAEIVKMSKKKKLFPKKYGSALRYKSTNSDVATVNSSGKVKAKKKGTCYIYVIALNGVKTAIKITVK